MLGGIKKKKKKKKAKEMVTHYIDFTSLITFENTSAKVKPIQRKSNK